MRLDADVMFEAPGAASSTADQNWALAYWRRAGELAYQSPPVSLKFENSPPEKIDYFGFVLPSLQFAAVKPIISITSAPRARGLLPAASKARMANLRRDNARRS